MAINRCSTVARLGALYDSQPWYGPFCIVFRYFKQRCTVKYVTFDVFESLTVFINLYFQKDMSFASEDHCLALILERFLTKHFELKASTFESSMNWDGKGIVNFCTEIKFTRFHKYTASQKSELYNLC